MIIICLECDVIPGSDIPSAGTTTIFRCLKLLMKTVGILKRIPKTGLYFFKFS